MPKEIFDILPPRKVETPKKRTIRIVGRQKIIRRPRFEKSNIKIKKAWLILILVLLGIISVYYFVPSEVKVKIKPRMETFGSKIQVVADEERGELDLISRIIPGYFLEEQNSVSQQFSSTGRIFKKEKARGIVRVYNDYSPLSRSLVANTRFMASDGKIFRISKKIIIPGIKTEDEKEVPGYVDVEVVADEAGSDYNIEATNFSIPGLAGTVLYTKIYGRSFDEMNGGLEEEIGQVTEEDLRNAEKAVIEKLEEEGGNILSKKAEDEGKVLLNQAFFQEIVSTSSIVEPGIELETFEFSGEVKSKALVFKEKDVRTLIRDLLQSSDLNGKKIYEESLGIDWESKEIDLDSGKIVLGVNFSVKTYTDISDPSLKKELAGKTIFEGISLLEEMLEIESVEVEKWPFWANQIPENFSKIKIELKLD